MPTKNEFLPVILCGGSGSRLWPLSRKSLPKQYISFKNDSSFLQLTLKRLFTLQKQINPIFICNEEHRFITAEQIREVKIEPNSIILEPCSRNTAPAITLAALKAISNGNDPILLVLPSDHLINNEKSLISTFKRSAEYAQDGKLVTFGIVPNAPETKYGYIEATNPNFINQSDASKIKLFLEKPNKEKAEKLIKNKSVSWNSGIFVFKASTFLKEIKNFHPEIYSYCQKAFNESHKDLDFERIAKSPFEKCPNISVDDAVMENTDLGMVIPLNAGWSDIGGWKSIWENFDKDSNGNLLIGDVLEFSSKNNLIVSDNRLVIGLGIEELIVVETNDSILVAKKDYAEKVKDLVKSLKDNGRSECELHKKVFRPWGNFLSIEEGDLWKVKRIEVNPGESLSLQLHNYRSEHWVVVKGKANVEVNEKKFILSENESCYIPLKTKHRLSNFQEQPLVIIEIQTGTYLEDDDILRFKDIYGREI